MKYQSSAHKAESVSRNRLEYVGNSRGNQVYLLVFDGYYHYHYHHHHHHSDSSFFNKMDLINGYRIHYVI